MAFLAPVVAWIGSALAGLGTAGAAAGAGSAAAGGLAGAGATAGLGTLGALGGSFLPVAAGLGTAGAAAGAGGLLSSLGGASTVIPAAMGAGSLGASYMQGEKAKKDAQEAQRNAMAMWQNTAYPSNSAVDAMATKGRGELGQARLKGYQNLSSNLAARGWGSGSGIGVKGAADIESNYLKTLGEQQTQLTQFKATPQWGPPPGAYPQNVPSGATNMLGTGGDMLNTALGMMAMQKLIGGGTGTPPKPAGFGGVTTQVGPSPYDDPLPKKPVWT